MRFLLIDASFKLEKSKNPLLPPLGLLYIGRSLEDDGHKVKAFHYFAKDFSEKKIDEHLSLVDAVGIGVSTSSYKYASKIAEQIKEIDSSDLSSEQKDFLKLAATRHIEFDYRKIADFYAHSSNELQNLMENSALVIIDYDKAIELGFVKLFHELETLAELDE